MTKRTVPFAACILTACVAAAGIGASTARAQIPGVGGQASGTASGSASGGMGGMSGMGGMGGMLGSAMGLPSVGSASSGNIAGVLQYCVQNNAVSSTQGNTVLSKLTSQGSVASSTGYQTGMTGQLETGASNGFSLSNLTQPLKQRLCRAVLNRAKGLI